MLTLQMMEHMWPNGNSKIPGLREGITDSAPTVFSKYGINSNALIAQIMAQISHECGAGTEVVENLNYSAERLMEVWPSRFPTMVSAHAYANNPRILANKVYNGRMGNLIGTDDGWNFRGRGATQTTGREGYGKLGQKVNMPLLLSPDTINNPEHFLECGVADFILCGCLEPAQKDDIRGVTLKLNGGYIGLEQRQAWLIKWKTALNGTPEPFPAPLPGPMPKPVLIPPVAKPAPVPQSGLAKLTQAFLSLFKRS